VGDEVGGGRGIGVGHGCRQAGVVEASILKACAALADVIAPRAFVAARSCGFGYTEAMHRAAPSRPTVPARPLAGWRAALLCLMIALLPVRSWAWTSMSVQTAMAVVTEAGAETMAPMQAVLADATPPCHAHAEAPSDESQATPMPRHDGGSSSHTSHQGCSLCDLCHAGVLPPQVWLWSGAAAPQRNAPGWTPATDTGRQGTDGLFRPPRH